MRRGSQLDCQWGADLTEALCWACPAGHRVSLRGVGKQTPVTETLYLWFQFLFPSLYAASMTKILHEKEWRAKII